MKIVYLDASAWVKRYYQEQGTEEIQALFVEGAILACASLGLVEVLATLSRKFKAQQINELQFEQKQREVNADWAQFIQIQLSDEVLKAASRLTVELALRGADAVHLASAVILQQNLPNPDEFILATSDQELRVAAELVGITTFDPLINMRPQDPEA